MYVTHMPNIQYSKTAANKEVKKIFSYAGWEMTKRISFLEYFSANIDFKKTLTESHIQYIFSMIDVNQNS